MKRSLTVFAKQGSKGQVEGVTTTSNTTTAARNAAGLQPVQPEFIRLPKTGSLCPWTGLSRSKLNELILPSPLNGSRPPVRSISLRNRGQIKAVRLINFDSLMAYLRGLESEQAAETTHEKSGRIHPFPTEHPLSSPAAIPESVTGLNREACASRTAMDSTTMMISRGA